MIFRLFALLAVVVLIWWGMSAVAQRYSLSRNQSRWLLILSMALTAIVALIAMGRLPVHFILAPLGVALTFLLRLLPTLLRLLPMWQMLKNSNPFQSGRSNRSGNQKSMIRTEYLEMALLHNTGDMDGEVIKGGFAGRKLASMTLEELLQLAGECKVDQDSIQVLEAYLDRMHGEWRDSGAQHGEPAGSFEEPAMNRQLALEILGLAESVTREEVVKAHRKLMQKMHPDRGGTEYLAKKINAARDYLVEHLQA
jgi:hypothetical protein